MQTIFGDFMPLVRWFDLDGMEKRLKRINKRADAFLQGLLEEHRNGKHSKNAMIEHLLTLQKTQPACYVLGLYHQSSKGLFR